MNEVTNTFNGIETNDDEKPSDNLRAVLCDRSRSAVRECFQPIRDNESLRAASVFRHEDILLLCDDEVDAYRCRVCVAPTEFALP